MVGSPLKLTAMRVESQCLLCVCLVCLWLQRDHVQQIHLQLPQVASHIWIPSLFEKHNVSSEPLAMA